MPRRRGRDSLHTLGPKTDESAASNAPPAAVAPIKKPSRTDKQRNSELARKTPYGSERDRRRTS